MKDSKKEVNNFNNKNNKLVELLPIIDSVSAVKSWLDNHRVEGQNIENEEFDTPVRTKEEYDEDRNEGHNQTECANEPTSAKIFDPGSIFARENQL